MTNAKSTGREQKNIWRIIKVLPENRDTYSLYLEGSDEKMAKRRAGQFVSLSINTPDGWSTPHPFSISNASEDPILCLTIKNVGQFTSAIPNLKPGTEVMCMGPIGLFCKDVDTKPRVVMIAGGVGITPFLSVLRHFRNIRAKNIATLFWVNRTMEDVFATDEIHEMTRELTLRVIYCLSRVDDVQGYYRQEYPGVFYEKGRLSGDILKRHGATKEASFYLCGPPPMMESALAEVGSLDVDQETIEKENFAWPGK
ncbi:MAG: FAD/NAD-binding family oxidoreductase [Syntrophales bacterium]